MGTTPTTPGGAPPNLPLSEDVLAAYQDVYDKTQTAIESTNDGALIQSMNEKRRSIAAVLTANNQCLLQADAAHFAALATQIKTTNDGLKKLKDDIAGIAKDISIFGDVVTGIEKVLTMVPGI